MIKGNLNKLELNEATMMEIVQQWLDREMRRAPKVSGVSKKPGESTPTNTFIIDLGEPPEDAEDA